MLAVIFALAAIFALTALAFAADGDTDTSSSTAATEASTAETRKDSARDDTTSSSTKADASSSSSSAAVNEDLSKALDSLSSAADSLSTKATLPNTPTKDTADTVTNAPGVTAFVDDDTTAQAGTTKTAAPVNTYVPKTGSSYAIPAVAVLALLAGTVAVVAVKKNED